LPAFAPLQAPETLVTPAGWFKPKRELEVADSPAGCGWSSSSIAAPISSASASSQPDAFVPFHGASGTPAPAEIKLHQKSRVLEISFSDGRRFELPYEFLRVYSRRPKCAATARDRRPCRRARRAWTS